MADKQAAISGIETLWTQFVKARALCPYIGDDAVGMAGYLSAEWYRARGATYFVHLGRPLTKEDIVELREIAGFINRSFIIALAAILETCEIVPSRSPIDQIPNKHVQLVKRLRHCFAHGQWGPNPGNKYYDPAKLLFDELFPALKYSTEGLPTSIDTVLEPLKDETLKFVKTT